MNAAELKAKKNRNLKYYKNEYFFNLVWHCHDFAAFEFSVKLLYLYWSLGTCYKFMASNHHQQQQQQQQLF